MFLLLAVFVLISSARANNCPATNYTQAAGSISSPKVGGKYPKNIECSYDIKVPEGKRAKLAFTEFNILGAMPSCAEASVDVYVSCGAKREKVATFCSCGLTAGKPFDIYSFDRCISVVFKSTDKAQGDGFTAGYSSISDSTAAFATPDCSNKSINASGNFYSPGWPLNYPNDTNCNWGLIIPKHDSALISLMSFSMEPESTCDPKSENYDYVAVSGVKDGSSKEIKRFCSQQLADEVTEYMEVGDTYDGVVVVIHSDGDINTKSGVVGGFSSFRNGTYLSEKGECMTKDTTTGQASIMSSILLIIVATLLSYNWPAFNH